MAKSEGTIDEVYKDDIKRKVQGVTIKRKRLVEESSLVIKQGAKAGCKIIKRGH